MSSWFRGSNPSGQRATVCWFRPATPLGQTGTDPAGSPPWQRCWSPSIIRRPSGSRCVHRWTQSLLVRFNVSLSPVDRVCLVLSSNRNPLSMLHITLYSHSLSLARRPTIPASESSGKCSLRTNIPGIERRLERCMHKISPHTYRLPP